MINPKYYQDIKKFPMQFTEGFKIAKDIKIEGNFNKVVLCGVGGSAFFVELINNYLATFSILRIYVNRSYSLPNFSDDRTLFLVASHSGNTEETLSCLNEIISKNFKYIILTSGGKLLDFANTNLSNLFKLPTGIQPRLSTGYFISGILKILANVNLIKDQENDVIKIASEITQNLQEDLAKEIAKNLKNKVPVIYATDNNYSIAMISKIKFNENTKTQSFWNYFPEVNHNEMVGFTNLVMNPYFIIYKSKFTNARNHKRIEIFTKIMKDKQIDSIVIEMKGESILAEILNSYFFVDHVTFYLSEEYGVDPEPVNMVEDFKNLMVGK